jgi:hypothetical protein
MSSVGLKRACQNIHQSTFAGAVLTNQGVHFTAAQFEVNAVESYRGAESFGYVR